MCTENIYIAGRYNKYLRNLSQSPWIDKDDVRIRHSVQELLEEGLNKYLKFDKSVFSSSGREDVDVRMLGKGRPFVFKLVNPWNPASYDKQTMRQIEEFINTKHVNKVQVRNLQVVTKESVSKNLKDGEASKTKEYRALCCCSKKLTNEDREKISQITDLCIDQKTPIRVLHRRSLAVRRRKVHRMRIDDVDVNEFECITPDDLDYIFTLTLLTEAGTYIKEFVHGDFGRTEPNLSTILGDCETDLMELDVMEVYLDWPPTIDQTDDEKDITQSDSLVAGDPSNDKMDRGELSLAELYTQGLKAMQDAEKLPRGDERQGLFMKARHLFELARNLVGSLSLFSDNETIDDVATSDLKYLLLPAYLAKIFTSSECGPDRLSTFTKAEILIKDFLQTIIRYGLGDDNIDRAIRAEESSQLSTPSIAGFSDLESAVLGRNAKIEKYKRMKLVESRLDELDRQVNNGQSNVDDEVLREYYLNLIKNWIEAVIREFDNKLETFSLKILVTQQDREYIVGLSNCSMEFLGQQENQDEDRRNFVELIINNMNTLLPKHSLSREPSANLAPSGVNNNNNNNNNNFITSANMRRSSSDEKALATATQSSVGQLNNNNNSNNNAILGDKKKFISQTQINGVNSNSNINSNNNNNNNRGRGSAARAYGQLSSRSQSVSVNQSDYLVDDQPMNMKSSYFTRRGSDHSDSITNDVTDDSSSLQLSGPMDSNASGLHQRQASLGQSFLDQTSTAFSSFHKQSMSFFKRLDTRAGDIGSTPPMSAKSDKGFDRTFADRTERPGGGLMNSSIESELHQTGGGGIRRNDFKSQSVDCSGLASDIGGSGGSGSSSMMGGRSGPRGVGRRETPPKPPPPQSLGSRQSSLASYSTQRAPSNVTTPNSTPTHTRQNTAATSTASDQIHPNRSSIDSSSHNNNNKGVFIRQNSALSAFEPFDPDLRTSLSGSKDRSLDRANSSSSNQSAAAAATASSGGGLQQTSGLDSSTSSGVRQANKSLESVVRRGNQFDSASITSGDSNSTSETTTAEDTMNNLKKTFASIFGDKCE